MSLSTHVYIGIDCDQTQLMLGFVGADGILRGLSTTRLPAPDQLEQAGQQIAGMVRGLRGEQNLRMKQFRGLGIGLPAELVQEYGQAMVAQLKPLLKMPVHADDRDALSIAGTAWLDEVGQLLGPGIDRYQPGLAEVYGAAKLAMERGGRHPL